MITRALGITAVLVGACGGTREGAPPEVAATTPMVTAPTPTPTPPPPPPPTPTPAEPTEPASAAHTSPTPVSATATAAATIVAGTERVVDRSTLTEVDGITVLVDEASTGVSTASMIQVVMAPDTRPTLARVDRREVWYVVKGVGYATGYYDRETQTVSPDWVEISAGDLLTVAPGGYRRIDAADTGLAVVIVSIPGGREDAARAGRLAGTDVTKKLDDQNVPGPTYVKTPRTHDRKKRSVEMYLDTAKRGTAKDAGAAVVTLRRGASVAEHTHTSETELLYVLDGHGTLVLDGVAYPITPTSAALIPAGATHTLTASDELRFFQLFTPGGPEKALTK